MSDQPKPSPAEAKLQARLNIIRDQRNRAVAALMDLQADIEVAGIEAQSRLVKEDSHGPTQ